ncbi:hypothetical protein FRC17_002510 [Serendipita sp. 399]|nr:hypothetical protein FRC17_002510 [Serendipita sp. 399]
MLEELIKDNGGSITKNEADADFCLVSSWKYETSKAAEKLAAGGSIVVDSPWVQSTSPFQKLSDESRDLREMALCLGRYRPIVDGAIHIYHFLHGKFPHRTSSQFALLHKEHRDKVDRCALHLASLHTQVFPQEEFFDDTRLKASHTRKESQTSIGLPSSLQSPIDLPSLAHSVWTADSPYQASPRGSVIDSRRASSIVENHDQRGDSRPASLKEIWAQPTFEKSKSFQNTSSLAEVQTQLGQPTSDRRRKTSGADMGARAVVPEGKPEGQRRFALEYESWNGETQPAYPEDTSAPAHRPRMFTQFEIDTMIQWTIDHPISEAEDKRAYWENFTKKCPIGPKRLSKTWARYYTKYLLPQLSQQKEILNSVESANDKNTHFQWDAGIDGENVGRDRSRIHRRASFNTTFPEEGDTDASNGDNDILSNVNVASNPQPSSAVVKRFTQAEVDEMLRWIKAHPIAKDEDLRKYWEEFAKKSDMGSNHKPHIWRAKYTRNIKPKLSGVLDPYDQKLSATSPPPIASHEQPDNESSDSDDAETSSLPVVEERRIHTPQALVRRTSSTPGEVTSTSSLQKPTSVVPRTSLQNPPAPTPAIEAPRSTAEALTKLSALEAIADMESMQKELNKIGAVGWGDYFDHVHEAFALKCLGIAGLVLDSISIWERFIKLHPRLRQDAQFWLSRYRYRRKHLENLFASTPRSTSVPMNTNTPESDRHSHGPVANAGTNAGTTSFQNPPNSFQSSSEAGTPPGLSGEVNSVSRHGSLSKEIPVQTYRPDAGTPAGIPFDYTAQIKREPIEDQQEDENMDITD